DCQSSPAVDSALQVLSAFSPKPDEYFYHTGAGAWGWDVRRPAPGAHGAGGLPEVIAEEMRHRTRSVPGGRGGVLMPIRGAPDARGHRQSSPPQPPPPHA